MVTYNGHIVGVCTARRAYLADHVDAEVDGERAGPFFLAMCLYAIEALRSPRWPRYTERRACRFARAMIVPDEVLEHLADFDATAVALARVARLRARRRRRRSSATLACPALARASASPRRTTPQLTVPSCAPAPESRSARDRHVTCNVPLGCGHMGCAAGFAAMCGAVAATDHRLVPVPARPPRADRGQLLAPGVGGLRRAAAGGAVLLQAHVALRRHRLRALRALRPPARVARVGRVRPGQRRRR
jgi:hypothetical protein